MNNIQIDSNFTLLKQFTTSAGMEYCSVYAHAEQKIITDVWSGSFGKQENFQSVLMYLVEEIKKEKYTKWLANLSGLQGGFKSSEVWLQQVIVPQVEKAGLRFEAVVLSKDIFAKFSVADSLKKLNEIAAQASMKMGKLEIKQFADQQAALEWLESKK